MIRILLILSMLMVSACTTSVAHKARQDFDATSLAGARLLYVEPDVSVYELGVAGAEEVPEWSAGAARNLNQYIREYLAANTGLEIHSAVDLTSEELESLEQHVALYSQVAAQHLSAQGAGMPGWIKHRQDAKYSLGPGLGFMKEKTDLDLALMTVAEDYVSSGGRVATQVAVALLFGAVVPGGHSVVHAGIVDLETGNISWTNTAVSTSHDLKNENGSKAMVQQVFSALPAPQPTAQPD